MKILNVKVFYILFAFILISIWLQKSAIGDSGIQQVYGICNSDTSQAFQEFKDKYGETWIISCDQNSGKATFVLGLGFLPDGNAPDRLWTNGELPVMAFSLENNPIPKDPVIPTPSNSNKLILVNLGRTPAYISPNGDGIQDQTNFSGIFWAKHTDEMEGTSNANGNSVSTVFYVEMTLTITSASNSAKTIVFDFPVNLGSCAVAQTGGSCGWFLVPFGFNWDGMGLSEGLYSFNLSANLIRKKTFKNGKVDLKRIDSLSTFAGEVVIDITPPTVQVYAPPRGGIIPDARPTILVSWSDSVSGLNLGTAHLDLDFRDKTQLSGIYEEGAQFTPLEDLASGRHTVKAEITDLAGNTGRDFSPFNIVLGSDFQATQTGIDFLRNSAGMLGLDPNLEDVEIEIFERLYDGDNYTGCFVSFKQQWGGVPVIDSRISVVMNSNGEPISIIGKAFPEIRNLNIVPFFSSFQALKIVENYYGDRVGMFNFHVPYLRIKLIGPVLVWAVEVLPLQNIQEPSSQTFSSDYDPLRFGGIFFINANNGDMVEIRQTVFFQYGPAFPTPPFDFRNPNTYVPQQSLSNLLYSSNGCLTGKYANLINPSNISCYGSYPPYFSDDIDRFNINNPPAEPSYNSRSGHDIRTSATNAYFHVNNISQYLNDNSIFSFDFPKTNPSQVDVNVNDAGMNGSTSQGDNAECDPTPNYGELTNVILRFGGGEHAGKTYDSSGTQIYIHRAFDRDAKAVYHEFGHGILARKGQSYAPTPWPFTAASYHEGGADFIATSVYIATLAGGNSGGNRNPLDWLIDSSNSNWRTCENLSFSDPWYYTEWLNSFNGHINGQALCQAMAMYQDRARSIFNRSLNYSLSEFILASGLFSFQGTESSMATAIPALVAMELIRSPFYGISLDQEIKAAFAAHGMIYDNDSRDAIIIDNNGEGHRYAQPDQMASYNVYAGKSLYFKIEFSKNSSFTDICPFYKFGSTDYIKHPLHRYWSGTIPADDISVNCWGSWNYYWNTIYYRVKTCDYPLNNDCLPSDTTTRISNRAQSELIGTNTPPTPGERCYSSGPFSICCNSNPFIETDSPEIFIFQLSLIIIFIFIMKRKNLRKNINI